MGAALDGWQRVRGGCEISRERRAVRGTCEHRSQSNRCGYWSLYCSGVGCCLPLFRVSCWSASRGGSRMSLIVRGQTEPRAFCDVWPGPSSGQRSRRPCQNNFIRGAGSAVVSALATLAQASAVLSVPSKLAKASAVVSAPSTLAQASAVVSVPPTLAQPSAVVSVPSASFPFVFPSLFFGVAAACRALAEPPPPPPPNKKRTRRRLS